MSAEVKDKVDLPGYSEVEFHADLDRVTGGRSCRELGRFVVGESLETVRWLKDVGGVDWWLSFRRYVLPISSDERFWGVAVRMLDEGLAALCGEC